jgi:predicted ATPase
MITGQDGFVASAPRQLLVGRRRETEHLRSLLEDALAGRGRLVMLVGKAGIGKTRTAEDLSSYSEFKGAHVLWGRCASTTGGVAFAPWVQILESYVRYRDPQSLRAELGIGAADIAQMVPAVRERLPQVGPARPLESEFARFRLFDEVTTFLKNAAAALPLVLILDDLQLADHSSLLLLGYLARRLSDSPLLLVGTYQVGAVGAGHPLAEIVTPLRQERRCEIVELSGLAEQDTRTLLVALGGKEVSDGLVQRLARKTDGNPFFLQEILWHLVEEGVFTMERDGWVSRGAPEDVPIPAGVRAVIGRRVGRLSPLCQEALTVAAVVDRDIGADVIAAVIEMSRERVQSALSEAVRARLLNEVPNGYRFPHALIAETLYAQLSAERAMQLHSRVGAVLERLHRHDLGPHLADLAHHFLRARADLRRAVDYAARAGERALASLAYEEAARHFTCALEALEGEAADWVESRRSNLLLALGDACWKMGDGQRARETFEAAAASARATGAAEQLARAALGFWGRFERTQVRAKDDRAVELLDQALSALGDDGALRAQVLACLAYALYFVPGTEGRRAALCEEAVIMAERAADARALMRVLHDRVWAL